MHFTVSLYKEKDHKKGSRVSTLKNQDGSSKSCVKCEFNLCDDHNCHVVGGKIDNERGIPKFFSPKGTSMLPGDIVWEPVKDTGKN